jgi:outer membrane biosynthesis protein TonB
MSIEPSPKQALAIFSMVFGRRGEERCPDMRTLGLSPAQRTSLVQGGLLDLDKARRGMRASLTDEGWAWAGDNLQAALDQKSPAAKTLASILARLDGFLRAHDTALADFAGEANEPNVVEAEPKEDKPGAVRKRNAAEGDTSRQSKEKRGSARAAKAKQSKLAKQPKSSQTRTSKAKRSKPSKTLKTAPPPTSKAKHSKPPKKPKLVHAAGARSKKTTAPRKARAASRAAQQFTGNTNASASDSLATRIRDAALAIAGGATRTRVRLRELRAHLIDVPREQVDRELFSLVNQGGVVLYGIDDTNDLDAEDVGAALNVAGYPRHVLYLEN